MEGTGAYEDKGLCIHKYIRRIQLKWYSVLNQSNAT